MPDKPVKMKFDTASAISQGCRDYQEDAMIADFTKGAPVGLAVLADGMGGHAAGDLASKIVVTVVFSELMFRRDHLAAAPQDVCAVLRAAARAANEGLAEHVQAHPDSRGMGATLLAYVVIDGALHWISIGDSPLFLFRDNRLTQLNEDHSLAPHIDMLVRTGAMTAAEGAVHPERNALTSVLLGAEIARIDCPEAPLMLQPGDTIILASDGLQFLAEDEIARILRERPFCSSGDLAEALMAGVEGLKDPDLDNVTLSVLQVRANETAPAHAAHAVDEVVVHAPKPGRGWPFRKRAVQEDLPQEVSVD